MAIKSIADQHIDTRVLISELSRQELGHVVTYAEHFTKWLGRPVVSRADMPTFSTVCKRLRADYSIVLSAVRGEGYKVLTHSETVADDSKTLRTRRMMASRKKDLATVDTSQLDDKQRLDYVCKVTQAHVVEEACREKSLKKIASVANGSNQPLALGHALEALKRNV